jgi:hypothetical protein
MKESQLGFEYSWEDLQPIRPLYVTVILTMFVGSGLALWAAKSPSWMINFGTGGRLASFPGFLLGLPIQLRLRPAILSVADRDEEVAAVSLWRQCGTTPRRLAKPL